MMNLIIRYPNGRDDHVSVAEGVSVLGSAVDCDVVISNASVGKRKLRLFACDNSLEIEPIISGDSIWLNNQPVSGRVPLAPGDMLRIGDISIMVHAPYVYAPDRTGSPNRLQNIRESIVRDVRVGWLGCRRVMEKLSSYISRDEAQIAEDCYESGRRAFILAFAFLSLACVVAFLLEFFQWYRLSSILYLCVQFCMNATILVLVGRFRMSFAGRIFWPLMGLLQLGFASPEAPCSQYWDNLPFGTPFVLGVCFLFGWMVDYGGGFVFEGRLLRKAFRFTLLVLSSCLVVSLIFITEQNTPSPISWRWSILAETPCLIWAFAYRRFLLAGVPEDSLFVAEIASRRAWKRMLYQILSVVLLAIPALGILSFLGEDERHAWPSDDRGVLWSDEETKDEAWFWRDRGRYFQKTDFGSNQIFQIPISMLESRAGTNRSIQVALSYENDRYDGGLTNLLYELTELISKQKEEKFLAACSPLPEVGTPEEEQLGLECIAASRDFVLTDFATNVCAHVLAVRTDPGDVSAYRALCGLLSDFHVSATNSAGFVHGLRMNSVSLVCNTARRRPEYGNEVSYVHSAEFLTELMPSTYETVKNGQADRARRKVAIVLVLVLAALALLILYRRGADSSVGFWLGLTLFSNVIVLSSLLVAGSSDGGIPSYLKHAIWLKSFSDPFYSLLAEWLSIPIMLQSVILALSWGFKAILFVILCWPTVKCAGKWRRGLSFVCKTLLVSTVSIFIGMSLMNFPEISVQLVVVEILAVGILGAWGQRFRRRRRNYTEIPRLGFSFFMGWAVTEIAIGVMLLWLGKHPCFTATLKMPFCSEGVEWGMVLGVLLPLLTLLCWVWLFLRQGFLNVLSLGGIMLILAVFAFPLAFRLLFSSLMTGGHDSVLVSRTGMQILSAVIAVVVLPVIVRCLRKVIRCVFMRNVCRMERDVAQAIEKVFDESSNRADSIFNVLSCTKISSFVFYERVSRGGFGNVVSRQWEVATPERLTISDRLRLVLGQRRELVDFEQLPYMPEYFFSSFELWRIHQETGARFMLPICLGTSVRGILFVGGDGVDGMPTDQSIVASINSFGLSTVTPR